MPRISCRLLPLLLLVFSGIAAATGGDAAQVNAFLDRAFDEEVARSPMREAHLGLHRDMARWDDFSETESLDRLQRTVHRLVELQALVGDGAGLDEPTRLSVQLFIRRADDAIEAYRWRRHDYVFTQMSGMHQEAPAFLINFHPIASEADARDYIARLAGLRRMFGQLSARAREAQQAGVLPPRWVFPLLVEACREVIRGEPFDGQGQSALWADFKAKLQALPGLDPATKRTLLDQARRTLRGSVKPAYEALIAMFEAQQRVATDDDGVWKLPDGEAYYAWRLREATTTSMSAEQIHALGLAEVARIHREMDAIRQRVGFAGDLKAFLADRRDNPKFVYPNTDEGRAAYIAQATRTIDAMRQRLPEFFGVLPRAPLVVKKVEAFRELGSASAFYQQPSPDGTRPGVYYVNTLDMHALPIWEMETLAHHEAIPGHHMQIAIAQELQGLPKFRRFGGDTAYVEGWALYSEAFPKEFGFYSDPDQDFGRLSDELLRAVRLVVDTGLHARHWTRQQVRDYFAANTAGSERDNFTETNRYIVWPGQATAYKVGMMKIMALREKAKAALGPKFQLRDFHDLVLKNGALPLDLLEQLVDAWIARQGG